MFFVEIQPRVGGKPIRLEASQVLITNELGDPLCVAGMYGPGGIKLAHAQDKEFVSTLRAFGYRADIAVDTLNTGGPPRGAKLVSGPR